MKIQGFAVVLAAVLVACGPDESGSEVASPTPTATPIPVEGALAVTLTWDLGPSDFDLHLALETSGGQFGVAPYDCSYLNTAPDWGELGSENDPLLEADAPDGPGPEIIRVMQPQEGASYRVFAHHFSDGGAGATSGAVLIQHGASEVVDFPVTSLPPDYVVDVGAVVFGTAGSPAFTVSGVEFPAPNPN